MSLDTDLQEPIQQPSPDQPPPQEQVPPVDEEAQLDADLEQQAIDVPDGDKLVPLSAVTTVRAKYKTAKQEASEAKQKAEQAVQDATRVRQALEEARPWIEAAKALAAAKQMGIVSDQPQQPPQPDPRERAELEAIAKDYDLYQQDGSLDVARAQRIIARERRIAAEAAQQHVAPLAQQTVQEQARMNLMRAKATTKLPDGRDVHVDADVLEDIWRRLDPTLTATKEGAQWAFMTAVGASILTGAPTKPAQTLTEPPTPPLYTEKAGGRDHPAHIVLDDHDKRIAKDLNMTEKEYAEMAGKMPWRR